MDHLKRIMIVRVTYEMYGTLETIAVARGLKISQLVRMILTDWLRGDGALPAKGDSND